MLLTERILILSYIPRMLDGCKRCGKGCECYWVQVKYLDSKDTSLPRSYKKLLHDFCIK